MVSLHSSSLGGSSSSVSSFCSSHSEAGPSSSAKWTSSGFFLCCTSVSHHFLSSPGRMGSPSVVLNSGRAPPRWGAESTAPIQVRSLRITCIASGCGFITSDKTRCLTGKVLSDVNLGAKRSRISPPLPCVQTNSFVTVVALLKHSATSNPAARQARATSSRMSAGGRPRKYHKCVYVYHIMLIYLHHGL